MFPLMDFRMSEICKHCKLGDFANFQVLPPLLSFMDLEII